ncbi:MAG: hypothetical protein AAGA30_09180, partial [Planctomycetota bacterium]
MIRGGMVQKKVAWILAVFWFSFGIVSISDCQTTFQESLLENEVGNGVGADSSFYELPGDGFTEINGSLALDGNEDGIDVYRIRVINSEDFYIRHFDPGEVGSADTKAFLFDSEMRAILQNEDDPTQFFGERQRFGFRDRSTHPGTFTGEIPENFENGCDYFLAVGSSGDVARDSNGDDLFLPINLAIDLERIKIFGPANGMTPGPELVSWTASGSGDYRILLTGAVVIAYSIDSALDNQFNWNGSALTNVMSDAANWDESIVPFSSATTDIFFDSLSLNNEACNDLTELKVRSIDVNCETSDFSLVNDGGSIIETEVYGRICVREGLPIHRFNVSAPIDLNLDSVMFADDGEFFIDGSDGKDGSIRGAGPSSGVLPLGVAFKGPSGRVTFNDVGSSFGGTPMGNFDSAIEMIVTFQGDNYFDPPMFAGNANVLRPNMVKGPCVFESSGGASINNGYFRFDDTVVIVRGGDVFTLDSADGPGDTSEFLFS